MARSDCASILASTGLPVVYHKWPVGSTPTFPCIRYTSDGADDFHADNHNYSKVDRWSATLVSDWKDDASEALIENALDSAHVSYYKAPDYYDDTEQLNHVEYTFELPR